MCLSHPNGFQIEDKYCSHLHKEDTIRFCKNEINCAEWEYGDETPVSFSLRRNSVN